MNDMLEVDALGIGRKGLEGFGDGRKQTQDGLPASFIEIQGNVLKYLPVGADIIRCSRFTELKHNKCMQEATELERGYLALQKLGEVSLIG